MKTNENISLDSLGTMEHIQTFLESSTIHGFQYIPTGKKYSRILWILVVISGFISAGILIYNSFQSWDESPVKTTIETLPISEMTFPKVTVCPPKDTYTDLNYDLMMSENRTLNKNTRKELVNYVVAHLNQHFWAIKMKDFRMMEEKDKYLNWYHGFTQISLPYHDNDGLNIRLDTAATSGTIFTKDFGKKFKADKVLTSCIMSVIVFPPENLQNNRNVTLNFEYENVPLKALSTGSEKYDADYEDISNEFTKKNHTPPLPSPSTDRYFYRLMRNVNVQEVKNQKLDVMPGFKVRWYYSGMEVESVAKYANEDITKAFVRYTS